MLGTIAFEACGFAKPQKKKIYIYIYRTRRHTRTHTHTIDHWDESFYKVSRFKLSLVPIIGDRIKNNNKKHIVPFIHKVERLIILIDVTLPIN